MFPGIQALRAVAALMIVLLHVGHEAGSFVGRPGAMPLPWLDAIPLDAGVDLFFVISGFVMVWAQRHAFGAAASVWPFVARRLWRVVPLYWLLTLATWGASVAAPHAMSGGAAQTRDLMRSLLFYPYRQPDGLIQPVLRLGWTLNYEMMFYALFAACLPFRAGRVFVLAALAALVAAGQAGLPHNVPGIFWTDPIVIEFGFGMVVGMLTLRGREPGWAWAAAMAGAAGLAAFTHGALAQDSLRALVAAVAVAAALRVQRVPRWLMLLGDASYALYLVHPFPMRALRFLVARVSVAPAAAIPYAVVATGAAVAAALLLHVLVERPLLRVGQHRLTKAVP